MNYDRPVCCNNIELIVVQTPIAWQGIIGLRVGRWCGWDELTAEPASCSLEKEGELLMAASDGW